MQIGGIVQARMSSTRLPTKVLRHIGGKPLLEYVLERLMRCDGLQSVVVATSSDPTDDPIEEYCRQSSVSYLRGSLSDVAGRFADVLNHHQWDGFVRVSGDSPLIDTAIVDQAVRCFAEQPCDVVTNVHPRTYPRGQSVEVISGGAFMQAESRMQTDADREHVTPYFYRHASEFAIVNLQSELDYSDLKMAVDTSDDLARVTTILTEQDRPHWEYSLNDLVQLYHAVDAKPRRWAA